MVLGIVKRVLVGRPMQSDRLGHTLLPKKIALPVFASDALSSVAYATEEILLVLSVGGLALFSVLVVAAIALINLRGVRESGTAFAIPTYCFVGVVALMIGWGLIRLGAGHHLQAESANYRIKSVKEFSGLALMFVLLRAFS